MAPASNTEICGNQVVRSFTAALINLGRGRIDQLAVRIERAKPPGLIGPRAGFNSPQRFGIDEKRSLHGAIVPPKPHCASRCVVKAALVRKTKRHGLARADEVTNPPNERVVIEPKPARRGSRDSSCCRTA